MKYPLFLIAFLTSISCFSQNNKNCDQNSDKKYNRLQILDSISKRLNKVNDIYEIKMGGEFSVMKENFYNFLYTILLILQIKIMIVSNLPMIMYITSLL
jgi:hypothetical protein